MPAAETREDGRFPKAGIERFRFESNARLHFVSMELFKRICGFLDRSRSSEIPPVS